MERMIEMIRVLKTKFEENQTKFNAFALSCVCDAYSDMYKDVNGVRPHFDYIGFNGATKEKYDAFLTNLDWEEYDAFSEIFWCSYRMGKGVNF